jgi:hypothetical protein
LFREAATASVEGAVAGSAAAVLGAPKREAIKPGPDAAFFALFRCCSLTTRFAALRFFWLRTLLFVLALTSGFLAPKRPFKSPVAGLAGALAVGVLAAFVLATVALAAFVLATVALADISTS